MKIFKQFYRYGNLVNTHDLLKAIAIITMIIDHCGLYLADGNLWMRVVGRSAAPLFFFVVGTAKSFRFRLDLVIYGLLLTLITYCTEQLFYFNILLSFVLIKWVLTYYNPRNSTSTQLIYLFIVLAIAQLYIHAWLEYGSFGLLFAFAGRLISQNDPRGKYWTIASLVIYLLIESYYFNFFMNAGYVILFGLISILLCFAMICFKFRTWAMPRILNYSILFLSRYSLQIYFIHLAGLKIYTKMIDSLLRIS